MHWILKLVIVSLGVYVFLSAYFYFIQSSLIYYPEMPGRNLASSPESIGLTYQNIELITKDNIKLHGWYIPNDKTKKTVLFFHGNAGNISHRLESIEIFHQLGLNVFIIDYRGYGESEGKTTEEGTYRDAEAAWNYLIEIRGISNQQIIIFGRSLGAAIATWLANKHTPAGLIIESGFTSVANMGQKLYPFLPIRWLTHFSYDTREYVKNISCPVMIAHSSDDEIIPYDEALEIFHSAPEPKIFLDMRGGHNDGFIVSGSDYIDGLRSFIKQAIKRGNGAELSDSSHK